MATVGDIARAIEEFAPLSWQESYDNVGLQLGDRSREATGALLCIDVTEEVVDEAIARNVNLIVSHHPLLFKGVKSLTGKSAVERTVIKAIRNDIAVYSAHTNLDNAPGGVNYRIAEILGLQNVRILDPVHGLLMKLVTYVPVADAESVRRALFSAGAGHIGNYDCCAFSQQGSGSFRAGEGAHPYCGSIGEIHHEPEERIEVILPAYLQSAVVSALLSAHPYEEPAYDLIALQNSWQNVGGGIIGELPCAEDETELLQKIKSGFFAGCLKHSRLLNRPVRTVAVCGGAGASLASCAVAAGADLFLTGEIRYHDYFEYDGRILLAEIGHYESEQFTKDIFCDIIQKKFPTFAIHYTKVETNPINYL